ncbi:ATP binding protein, putative [Ricinus communis]|uniref:ATP binding protein, putative n=1 Tax=Ricinus communis TaxID=3988 RepID=B9SU17_RICCO|nr:ATP binding protein, putative [Ricinus communis]|eukprot:XP_002529486.1 probable disease resistance RPP8-like protein 2 [Ricinus communis]
MDVAGLYIGLEDRNSLAVLGKLSNLLIHESVPLLGFEDQLELIESKLREVAAGDYIFYLKNFGDIVRDIEEVIDVLATLADEKRAYIEIFPSFLVVFGFNQRSGDVQASFERGIFLIHCALALNDLIHQYKLKGKLDEIRYEIFSSRRTLRGGGSWRGSLPKELESSETIISPVLEKTIALSNQRDVSPAVRKKARKLRDNFTVLQVCLNYLESKELSEHGMSWVEKICDVSRSAEDVISLFMCGRKDLSKSWKGHNFLNVVSAFDNFNSQKKLGQEVDRINSRLEDIIRSRSDEDLIASAKPTFPRQFAPRRPINKSPPPPPPPCIAGSDSRADTESSTFAASGSSSGNDVFSSLSDEDFDDNEEDVKLPEQTQLKCLGQLVSNLQGDQITKPLLPSFQKEQTQHSTMSSSDDTTIVSTMTSLGDDEQVDITGFEQDADDIMEMLLKDDPNCHTISIVGIEGIGQKEVAKLVYEHPATRNHFPHRAWVPRPLFNDLIEQIVGEKIDIGYYHRYRNGYLHLLNQMFKAKKYLIIIDKVYSTNLWDDIREAFDGLSNGTRVVFITYETNFFFPGQRRTPEVSERNFIYRLHLRNDDESWVLFTRSLKMSIHPDLLKLKRQILRRCGGLPTIIQKLAGQLSEKDATLEEWSSVLEQLSHDKEPWKGALCKINKELPLYLRRCLFYFGLFPQDLEIPARRLIALWVAEGLGRQKGDKESPESVSEKCLMELVDQNVIQVAKKKLNGKIKTCRLPHSLRVHWLSKAKEASFIPDNSSSSSSDSRGIIRRLADHLDPEDPSYNDIHGKGNNSSRYSRYRDVISFLSFDNREGIKAGEDLGNFLDRCICTQSFHFLWVLDLERVYKPKLPKAIGQLIRLRYFGLRSTYLVILPFFINKLLNLQTLDLKRTHINTIPSSIWKMKKLRHLFLDDSSRSMFLPRPKSSTLVDLQTLWGACLDEESPVKNGLDTLLNIKKLGLKCRISVPPKTEAMSSQLDAIANWILSLKGLQSLRLKSFDESNKPWNLHLDSLSGHVDLCSIYLAGKLKNQHLISEFPKNLIELTLSASGLVEDPMQALDKLPNLKIVILLLGSFIGKRMLCRFGGFPKLEVLKFKKLMQLEEWNVEEGALPSLKDLEIESCSNLKMISAGLRLVSTLREVKLAKMPMIASKIKDHQGEEWNKIAHARNVCIED